MEVTVTLHGALRQHARGRHVRDVRLEEEATVGDLLDALAVYVPAVERRIRDEAGRVRPHVNLFVDGHPVRGPGGVDQRLHDGAEVLVLPAVSGG